MRRIAKRRCEGIVIHPPNPFVTLLKSGLLQKKEFRYIVDFRNKIVHAYFGIDEEIVFDISRQALPRYIEELKKHVLSNHIDLSDALDALIIENRFDREAFEYLEEELFRILCQPPIVE